MPRFSAKFLAAQARRKQPIYAFGNFNSANYYQTAVDGGEAGVGTGFLTACLFRLDSLPAVTAVAERFSSSPNTGHTSPNTGTNSITFTATNGSATFVTATHTVTASDVGRLFLVVSLHNGAVLQLWTQRQLSATAAISGYTPASAATRSVIGARVGGSVPATSISFIGELTARGIPSNTQIEALFDYVKLNSDLPPTFPMVNAVDADITTLAPRHWYRADTYTSSGTSLTALTNKGSGGGQMAVVGATITVPAADVMLNGQSSVTIAPSPVQCLESSLASSSFSYLHDGTGAEVWSVFVPTGGAQRSIWSTRALQNNAEIGLGCQYTGPSPMSFYLPLSNGTATIGQPIVSTTAGYGIPTCQNARYQENIAVEIIQEVNGQPVSVVATSAAPVSTAPQSTLRIGATTGNTILGEMRFADFLSWNRILTESERQKVRDYIRTRYGIGVVATTHRWSLRSALAAAGTVVVDGQIAPASLLDTITASVTDRMDKQGSPVVKVIDPSIDGKKSYGALGFSTASYLTTPGGIRGTDAGMWIACVVRYNAIPTTTALLAASANSSATDGWYLQSSSALLRFSICGTTQTQSTNYTVTASDVGIPMLVVGHFDGTNVRIYIRGAQVGADVAKTSAMVTPSGPMLVGLFHTSQPFTFGDIFGLAGGNSNPSVGEINALFSAFSSTGRIQAIPGKTDHLYDLTPDSTANGGPANGVPTTVLDRIGTDHLTRSSGLCISSGGGISGFASSGNDTTGSMARTVSSALPGSVSGFYAEVLADFAADSTSKNETLFSSATFAFGKGWAFQFWNALATVYLGHSGGTYAARSSSLTSGLYHLALVFDGSILKSFINGTLFNTSTAFTFIPSDQPALIGSNITGTSPTYGIHKSAVRGGVYGEFIPSDSEIAIAASSALSSGKIVGIPGKFSASYSIPDDVMDAGGQVPTIIKERVSGTQPMVIRNNSLQVAQRTERLWGYETNPILHGAKGFTTANYYKAAVNSLPGSTAGFAVSALFRVESQAVASATRVLFSQQDATPCGWAIYGGTTAGTIYLSCGNGSVFASSPTVTIAAAEVGKLMLFTGVYDSISNVVRAYVRRVQQGTGTALAAPYTVPAVEPRIGLLSNANYPTTDGFTIFGFQYCLGIPNLAQIQAHHDAVMTNEKMVQIPGFMGTVIDLTQDGGAVATLTDRDSGGVNFTRQGSPTTVQNYVRNWAW